MSEIDKHGTPYTVHVRWSPVQEFVVSIQAYLARSEWSTMDLGAGWARSVRRQIDPALHQRLARNMDAVLDLIGMLSLQPDAPGEVDAFLDWIASRTVGDLYERAAALQAEEWVTVPAHLASTQREAVDLGMAWNTQYFATVDPAILDGLSAEAARMEQRAGRESPIDLVEDATGGVRFLPSDPVDIVLLMPQYHYRPWNIYGRFGRLQLFRYPADVLPSVPGEPPLALLRMTRALGDDSRLRMLRCLARGTRSFTDLVRFMGLSKSTVHHHLVILRAAGLVRLEHRSEKNRLYTLRPGIAEGLSQRLTDYLDPEE